MHRRKFLFSLLMVAFPVVGTSQAQLLEQRTGPIYAMGVNFGIVSYFSSALSCCKGMRSEVMARSAANGLLNVENDLIRIGINSGGWDKFLPLAELKALQNEYSAMANNFAACSNGGACGYGDDWKAQSGAQLTQLFTNVLSTRDGITTTFSKISKRANDTYVLGVNVGIAEGHATQGESTRLVVYASLTNARNAAQQLNLDLAPIDACIALASGSTPIEDSALGGCLIFRQTPRQRGSVDTKT